MLQEAIASQSIFLADDQIVLYGSYARGTNTSESDVDVASFNIIYSKNSSSSASSTGRA
ncbi:nucleotidyltransferase domain-containing protein [Blautia massiliensis]|nr:nucleotidyltransferase domain-containing protein [Blautia massiliensis (ex Durand et al. 2017)]